MYEQIHQHSTVTVVRSLFRWIATLRGFVAQYACMSSVWRSVFYHALLVGFVMCVITFINTPVNAAIGDMVSPVIDSGMCITADGITMSDAVVRMLPCRGLDIQQWQIDAEGKWHVQADPTYCIALDSDTVRFAQKLVLLPCTHSRVRGFAAEVQPDQTVLYTIAASNGIDTLAFDSGGVNRRLYLYYKGVDNQYQRWRWFQTDLNLAQAQGCALSYPVAVADSTTYQRELACDRVAQVQPPYEVPANIVRDPSIFPGAVANNAPRVTQTFSFNLAFKDPKYLRMKYPPANWLNTGLYAPPNQVVRVVIANATATDVLGVAVQLGVHTDKLQPTSTNVISNTGFLRYPNVVTRVPLQVGENLVRSPYGGPIVLTSNTSVTTTIQVTIDGVLQAPYLKVGTTTPPDWITRRSAAVPYGSLESDRAVVYVPTSELSQLSYEEASAVAQSYSTIGAFHNQLAGLSPTDIPIHQPPQGQFWYVADTQITTGWGHAGFPIMTYNAWNLGTPEDRLSRPSWGIYHELGHGYQMRSWSDVYGAEVTVNLFSLSAQEQLFGSSPLIDKNVYAKAIAVLNDPTIPDKWNYVSEDENNPLTDRQMVFLDQIRLGSPQLNWQLWTRLMRRYREMSETDIQALNTDQLKRDKFMTLLCEITSTNLTPHFEAWTISISDDAKTYCAKYPLLTREIWKIDDTQPRLEGIGDGWVTRSYWTNLKKTATIEDLTSLPTYPYQPTGTSIVTQTLESPQTWGDRYGQLMRGYLIPPVSGEYRFWLAGDDRAQFRLSPNANPFQATALITMTQWTSYREFDKYPVYVQRSQPVRLEAGQRYYFEVIHLEAYGGDHVSVAWEIPATETANAEPRKPIAARFLSPIHIYHYYLPIIRRP